MDISAIIIERQHQLDAVSHNISGLQTIMDGIQTLQQQLFEQKNGIIESINLHKRLISPLWRLPTEVLSQIFYHCLPQFSDLNELQLPSKLSAPMLLTRVCRLWREVAVGMPNLWCMLSVEVDDRDWQPVAFCYDSWLKRARGRSLSIRLGFHADGHWSKIQCLLRPYVNQISSLRVDIWYPDHDEPELNMFANFPALEEIFMNVYVYHRSFTDDGDATARISRSFSQLPLTLDSLAVSGLLFGSHHLSSCNPWAHLTTIKIEIWQPDGVLQLLQLAPNLSSLTVIIFFDYVQEALEPFTHTKLQTLHITRDCYINTDVGPQFCDLFNALSLPTLRALAVHNIPKWPHEEFKAFLARSGCPLESLIVSDNAVIDEQAEYVALVPSLQFVLC
ncbi:hypothetical protein BDR07DRAFT_1340357 [Suillus spraguei]|nr:hypothetical protein BDR07DRAFT_1340357 [Suillus spraguei]